jgi:hypothetical protein
MNPSSLVPVAVNAPQLVPPNDRHLLEKDEPWYALRSRAADCGGSSLAIAQTALLSRYTFIRGPKRPARSHPPALLLSQ